MKLFVVLIGLISLLGFKSSGFNDSNALLWRADRKLSWSDYKAKPKNFDASDGALTASSIQTEFSYSGNEFIFSVEAKFYPYESWYIKTRASNELLEHEQLHFDITELYARMLKQELLESIKTKKDIHLYKSIVSKYMKDWDKTQEQYDEETNHSINKEKQKIWQEMIENELETYSQYQQSKYQIILK